MVRITSRLLLFLLLLGSFYFLRLPTLKEGKPFFYQEDEAHHFNRIVNMVKHKTLNPEYFHKPSLHFYLRMPMVLGAVWLSEHGLSTESLKAIRTHDRYGLARYSFSWSHPRVVYAVRAVSLILTMCTILLVYIVARQLGLSIGASFFAFSIIALSPELFRYSSYIGVDVPLMFFSLLTSALALRYRSKLTASRIWIVGLSAGLAVSSKYNGLPIALLPLILVTLNRSLLKKSHLLGALLAPTVGFFAASPYILISFPLFYKQLSYEVWHYAVAGHAGHSSTPGIGQFLHYSQWLMSDGIGASATTFTAFGAFFMLRKLCPDKVIFLSFPLLFSALMCAQKANFVRNMLPILPYCSILAGYALDQVLLRIAFPHPFKGLLVFPLALLTLLPPLERSLYLRSEILTNNESRIGLEYWLKDHQGESEVAISGDLQPQYSLTERPGISTVPPKQTFSSLFQSGFDLVVVPTQLSIEALPPPALASSKRVYQADGFPLPMRIVQNPALSVYLLQPTTPTIEQLSQAETIPLTNLGEPPPIPEPYFWLTNRLTYLKLPSANNEDKDMRLRLEFMSPWQNQEVMLIGHSFSQTILLNTKDPGQWIQVEVAIPKLKLLNQGTLLCVINKISSPASRQGKGDERRLGAALKIISD